ncbi:MAG: PDZ domain-containing protein [Synergistaceae bacterium]|nr:PDZ domain-containing protein [Synergistaceae bacterium]
MALLQRGVLKMKSRMISIAVMMCLFAVPAAQAVPHPGHHPGPPPRPIFQPYHRPGYYNYPRYRNYRYYSNNDIWVSLGAGLLIGAMISNMNRTPQYSPSADVPYSSPSRNDYSYSNSYERERQIRDIKTRISQNAKTEADRASNMASEFGSEQAMVLLEKTWDGEGKRTNIDRSSGLQVLKVTGFYDGSQISYTFLPENRKVYVRISVPEYSLSAEESDYYSGPAGQAAPVPSEGARQVPVVPNYTAAAMIVSGQGGTMQYAGFELERTMRSPSGHMIIREVAKGTAAYYAGIRPGDVLLKVDVYETRNFDPVWFIDYISSKHQSRSLITLSISRNGAEKRFEIQL